MINLYFQSVHSNYPEAIIVGNDAEFWDKHGITMLFEYYIYIHVLIYTYKLDLNENIQPIISNFMTAGSD